MYSNENNSKKANNNHHLYWLRQIEAEKFLKNMKKDITKIFMDGIYSSLPKKKFPTNRLL